MNVCPTMATVVTNASTLQALIFVDVSLVLSWIQMDELAQITMNVRLTTMAVNISAIISMEGISVHAVLDTLWIETTRPAQTLMSATLCMSRV